MSCIDRILNNKSQERQIILIEKYLLFLLNYVKHLYTVHIHIGTLFAKSAQTVPSLNMHRLFSAKNKPAMDNNTVKFHCKKETRYDT
jgi:hypothetical protein